jgi:uracil phosphoribosyltransferase
MFPSREVCELCLKFSSNINKNIMTVCLADEVSIAHHYLTTLRDVSIQQDRMRFRFCVERLGEIMAVEISKKLEYRPFEVKTPLGIKKHFKLKQDPVLITVLRAGLPYWQGFQRVFENSDCGFIGAYRQEGQEIKIKVDYVSSPSLEGRDLILIDPMLATGKSMVDAIAQLRKKGNPKNIFIAALIGAPEGIAYIESKLGNEVPIWLFSIDEKLNEQSYIVPGLGDAGDLSFGEKV